MDDTVVLTHMHKNSRTKKDVRPPYCGRVFMHKSDKITNRCCAGEGYTFDDYDCMTCRGCDSFVVMNKEGSFYRALIPEKPGEDEEEVSEGYVATKFIDGQEFPQVCRDSDGALFEPACIAGDHSVVYKCVGKRDNDNRAQVLNDAKSMYDNVRDFVYRHYQQLADDSVAVVYLDRSDSADTGDDDICIDVISSKYGRRTVRYVLLDQFTCDKRDGVNVGPHIDHIRVTWRDGGGIFVSSYEGSPTTFLLELQQETHDDSEAIAQTMSRMSYRDIKAHIGVKRRRAEAADDELEQAYRDLAKARRELASMEFGHSSAQMHAGMLRNTQWLYEEASAARSAKRRRTA